MTQEEKANAYDKALKEASIAYKDGDKHLKAMLEIIFPELIESEDERIRKDMIIWLKGFIGEASGVGYTEDEIKERIAYLEKQGKKKPTDKVKSKFNQGDWVIDKQGIVHQIENVIQNMTTHIYGYDIVGGGYFNDEVEGVRLWTIDDAKNGDILTWDDSKCIVIFKNIYDKESFNSYGLIGHCTGIFESRKSYHYITGVHPATKEQRDLLFRKMKEAGYEWDDKEKLKKI